MASVVVISAQIPFADVALKRQLAELPEVTLCVVGESAYDFKTLLKAEDKLVEIPLNPLLKHMSPARTVAYSFYLWLKEQQEITQVFLVDHGGVGYYALQARHALGQFESISFALWMYAPTVQCALAHAQAFNSISMLEAHFMEQRCYALVEECEFLEKGLEHYPEQQSWKHETEITPLSGTPKVSVCITHYNRPQMAKEALQSIQKQTYTNIEIIVVDDGSTEENVAKALQEIEAQGVRVIVQENKYLGAARNTGAKAATGDYILFMDDDNIAMPHEVAQLVKVAQRTQADVVTTAMRIFETSLEKDEGIFCPLGGDAQSGFFSNVFGDANALWKKSTFQALGGFTEDYGVGYEDWELFSKAVLKNYRLELCPEPSFYYRELPTRMSTKTPFYKNHYRALRPYLKAHPKQEPLLMLAQGMCLEESLQSVERRRLQAEEKALHSRINHLENEQVLLQQECENLRMQRDEMNLSLVTICNSTSWKLTYPLRYIVIHLKRMCPVRIVHLKLAGEMLLRGDVKMLFTLIRFYFRARYRNIGYDKWIRKFDTSDTKTIAQYHKDIAAFKQRPLLSVVMPVYNVEENWLRKAIESVRAQIYPHWELCIADDCSTKPEVRTVLEEYQKKDGRIKVVFREKNGHISESSNSALALATGEFVVLMDHDDMLPSHALYWVAKEIENHPDVQLIYSDEDKIDAKDRRFNPYFKSDWNLDLCLAQNMFSHLGVYRRSLVQKIKGFRKGYEGSQDHDLLLRCLLQVQEKDIRHIPKILYHWRAIEGSTAANISFKNYAVKAGANAIQDFLNIRYPGAREVPHRIPVFHRVLWPVPALPPMVSLIIPTRNLKHMLESCIASILEKTIYPNYEIIIVDNQSEDLETIDYFKSITAAHPHIRVIAYDAPFNYSAINNFGVKQAKGEIIGLLNNDMTIISTPTYRRCWMTEMVAIVSRREVGAAGVRLLYPSNKIQHAGVILGAGVNKKSVATHSHLMVPAYDPGYFGRAMLTQEFSAVTGACLFTRKELFEAVGGLDAKNLPVSFNDVDYCLRLREHGYKIIYVGDVELYHYESMSRGKAETFSKDARFNAEEEYMQKRWADILWKDPFYNPNLRLPEGDFALAFPPRLPQ